MSFVVAYALAGAGTLLVVLNGLRLLADPIRRL